MRVRMVGPKEVLSDLRRMARGKEPKSPAFLIAKMAIPYIEDGIERDETAQLFRMFRLPDTRPDA